MNPFVTEVRGLELGVLIVCLCATLVFALLKCATKRPKKERSAQFQLFSLTHVSNSQRQNEGVSLIGAFRSTRGF